MVFESDPYFMEPEYWGPFFWKTIESVVCSMNEHDEISKEYVYSFFYSLQNVLPCPTCRQHYQDFFSSHDLRQVLDQKKKIFQWVYKLKMDIRRRNESSVHYSFDDYMIDIERTFQPHGIQ